MKKIIICMMVLFRTSTSLYSLSFDTGSFFNGNNYENKDFYNNINEEKRINIKFQEYIVSNSQKKSLIKLKSTDVLKTNFHLYDSENFINMSTYQLETYDKIDDGFYLIIGEINKSRRPVYVIHILSKEIAEVGEFIYVENKNKKTYLRYVNFVNLRPKPQWSFAVNTSKLEYQYYIMNNYNNKTSSIMYIYSGGVPVCYYTEENDNFKSKILYYKLSDYTNVNEIKPSYEIRYINNIPANAVINSIKYSYNYDVERDYTYWIEFDEIMDIYSNIIRINKISNYKIIISEFNENANINETLYKPRLSIIKYKNKVVSSIETTGITSVNNIWFPDIKIIGEKYIFTKKLLYENNKVKRYKYYYKINNKEYNKTIEYNLNEIEYIQTDDYKGYDSVLYDFFIELEKQYLNSIKSK